MIEQQIKEMIDTNDVILFMKGDPHQPKCGFSARVVEVLIEIGKPFSYVDVLDDPNTVSYTHLTLPTILLV